MEATAEALDASARAEILQVPTEWLSTSLPTHMIAMAEKHGAAVAVVLRPYFLENAKHNPSVSEAYFDIPAGTKSPELARKAAYVCLDAVARLP
jgi:hypothetical protein